MVRGGLSGDHARIVNVSRPKRSAAGGDTAFGRQEGAAAIEGAPVGKACVGVEGRWYDVTPFIEFHPGGDVILGARGRSSADL